MTTASRTLGLLGQRGLDLSELDPEAADLHLVIDPAEVFEVAALEPAREVAAAVETSRRALREAVGDETLAPSAPAGSDSRARRRRRRRTSRPGRRAGQARPRGRARARCRSGIGTPMTLPGPPRRPCADRPVGHVHGGLGDPVHVDELRLLVAVSGRTRAAGSAGPAPRRRRRRAQGQVRRLRARARGPPG